MFSLSWKRNQMRVAIPQVRGPIRSPSNVQSHTVITGRNVKVLSNLIGRNKLLYDWLKTVPRDFIG